MSPEKPISSDPEINKAFIFYYFNLGQAYGFTHLPIPEVLQKMIIENKEKKMFF